MVLSTATIIRALLVQMNETMLRSIVTYPDKDYFLLVNLGTVGDITSTFIVQACRIIPAAPCIPLTTGTTQLHILKQVSK